jgi:CBS domain-containing protein
MATSSTAVREFLRKKSRPVITTGPEETVETAIRKLVENSIGALPVCDTSGAVIGIISERDLLKECLQRPASIGSTRVNDVMTRDVVIGLPDDDLDYVTSVMTQKKIRHLPIMDGRTLAGMVSIRDVVDEQLAETRAEARLLSDYISGGYR